MEDQSIRFEVFRSHEPLKVAWSVFQNEACCTVFQTYEWASHLLDTVGRAHSAVPAIVLLSNAEGVPLMLLPLTKRQHEGARLLEFIDFDTSDYNAPLIRRDFAMELARQDFSTLWSKILKHIGPVDAVKLRKMPPTIDGAPNPFHQLNCQKDLVGFNCSLQSGFTEYMNTRGGHMNRELRRSRRKLEGEGPVELRIASDPETASEYLKTIIQFKSAWCRANGIPDQLSKPIYSSLYDAIASQEVRGIAHTSALMVGERMIAGNFGFIHRGRFYGIIQSSDFENYKAYSPGNLMLVELMRWCSENGISIFDFSIGSESYKGRWADDEEQLYQYGQAMSIPGMLIETRRRVVTSFKASAPPQLVETLRNLRTKVRPSI